MNFSLEKIMIGRDANALGKDYLFTEYCKYRISLFIPTFLSSIVLSLFDYRLENATLAWFWLITMLVLELLKVNLARLNLLHAFQYKKPFLFFDYLSGIWGTSYLIMLGWQAGTESEFVFKGFFIYCYLVYQLDALRFDLTKLVLHAAIVCLGILCYLLFITSFDSQITLFYGLVIAFGFFIFLYFGRNSHVLALETYDLLLESERLLTKIDHFLVIDESTKQYNRSYFDAQLNKYLKRYQNTKQTFTVALLSVNFFERVEETYGKPLAGQLLVSAAEYVREQLNDSRVFAKYSDDAFALILPDTPIEKANDELDVLRRAFANKRFIVGDCNVSITFSIGIAQVDDADDETTILNRAHSALYQAKVTL